jgi:uncharacterized cupredoxin-like copper-binding protein
MVRKGSAAAVLIALVALATAVSAFGRPDAATPVAVTAGKPAEFNFTLSKKTVKKGTTVAFKVTNKGTIAHDFKINGKKTASLKTGKTQTISVAFKKAGKYTYLCTLPGHAPGGMKGTFVVK